MKVTKKTTAHEIGNYFGDSWREKDELKEVLNTWAKHIARNARHEAYDIVLKNNPKDETLRDIMNIRNQDVIPGLTNQDNETTN